MRAALNDLFGAGTLGTEEQLALSARRESAMTAGYERMAKYFEEDAAKEAKAAKDFKLNAGIGVGGMMLSAIMSGRAYNDRLGLERRRFANDLGPLLAGQDVSHDIQMGIDTISKRKAGGVAADVASAGIASAMAASAKAGNAIKSRAGMAALARKALEGVHGQVRMARRADTQAKMIHDNVISRAQIVAGTRQAQEGASAVKLADAGWTQAYELATQEAEEMSRTIDGLASMAQLAVMLL